MDEIEFKVTVKYGHSELRAWVEAEVQKDGPTRLIGMGSRVDYDENNQITDYKVGPTGLTATIGG